MDNRNRGQKDFKLPTKVDFITGFFFFKLTSAKYSCRNMKVIEMKTLSQISILMLTLISSVSYLYQSAPASPAVLRQMRPPMENVDNND